jgi:predicted nucleic acid-binding protein
VSGPGAPRAVLDSDILFSRVLHELMGRVAKRLELLDLVWSEELLAETSRSLVTKKGLSEDAAKRWVSYLPESFPDGKVDLAAGAAAGTDLGGLTEDPDDHHVCRLVLESGAAYLFTHDRGYLRDALNAHGVEVTSPDPFLVATFDEGPDGFLDLLEQQAAIWAGGRPVDELLAAIERAGAANFAGKARTAFGR